MSTKKKYNLRPRARIVRTFGEELISSNAVAIIELVKNSYDADARIVTVRMKGPLVVGSGSITVEDNGKGMSPDEVETSWMEPASTSKLSVRRSKEGRPYLGQKGIGRFSSAKLADKLILTTYKDGFEEVQAEFNWSEYYNPDKYLDEIEGEWETREPEVLKGHGTILSMEGLRSDWLESDVRELSIQLQRLISPVGTPEDFKIFLELPDEFSKYSGEVTPSSMLQNPTYTIKGRMDNNGNLMMTYSSDATKTPVEITKNNITLPTGRKPDCGPLDFEFRVWDRDKDRLKKLALELGLTEAIVREDLTSVSGVSVYRDSFRVAPYGDRGNDWLRLDLRRVQSPTLRVSNNQVIGRISISDEHNPLLKDQTNREGIVQSDAFEDIREVARIVLNELEGRRYKERRPESYLEGGGIRLMQQKVDLNSVREIVERKIPGDKELQTALDVKEAEINDQVGELREVITRYRRLSTMGQLMDVVLHEVGNYILRIKNGAKILEREVDGKNEKINRNIVHIHEGTRLLTDAFKRLEPFGGRKRERVKVFNIEDAITEVFDLFGTELERLSVSTNISKSKTPVKLSEPELKEIVVNLLTNSLYWFEYGGHENTERKVEVKVETTEHYIEVIFQDNGPGVAEDDADVIFSPYYTKKPDGIGLGLTIVGEIVADYNGTLELINNGQSGAAFRLKLPIAETGK